LRVLTFKLESLLCSAVLLSWVAMAIIFSLCVSIGIIMYAFFHGCDPLLTEKVAARDQVCTIILFIACRCYILDFCADFVNLYFAQNHLLYTRVIF